jgi:hypothetical protein
MVTRKFALCKLSGSTPVFFLSSLLGPKCETQEARHSAETYSGISMAQGPKWR